MLNDFLAVGVGGGQRDDLICNMANCNDVNIPVMTDCKLASNECNIIKHKN